MNMRCIEASLPSGFHDALIMKIEVDFCSYCVALHMKIWWDDMDDYRKAELILSGMQYFMMEPPSDPRGAESRSEGLRIDLVDDESSSHGRSGHLASSLPSNLPTSAFAHCFYAFELNSFIYFAATDAVLKWME